MIFMFLDDLLSYWWKPALFSFLLAFFLIFFALRIFPLIGLMDRPERYGLKRKPIPYYGGLIIFIAIIVSVLLYVPMTLSLMGLLIGAFIIMALGFFDDLFSINPFIRLFFQFVACVVLVVFGIGILSINLPFFGTFDFSSPILFGVMILSVLFTIIWVMTILNTMNFVDGVAGISSGVSFIAGLTIFVLSVHPGIHLDPSSQIGVATIALIVSMVSLAFLFFDFPAPKMLMGDTGSTLLGFLIATLAIFSGGKVATAFLVLGIPILDMVWVVLRRIYSGQKFWKGDLKHLHHRLISAGFSERNVVTLYLIITTIFGFLAVSFVSTDQKFFILIGLLLLMSLLAVALLLLPKKK
jgi:UDP-GlcNAc:undecaprenyl-phosphate GlcNAc-1-phosphate transferase